MVLAVAALVVGGSGGARADNGIGGFFQQIFGGGQHGSSDPLPQPDYAEPASPPLTVRMHKHRRPSGEALGRSARYTPEELKNVTIYTDRTLVPGDAVMTKQGLRIFTGEPASTHTAEDFVALSSASKVAKTVRKELTAIDVASRSDFRGD
jgi:hypothetical protein